MAPALELVTLNVTDPPALVHPVRLPRPVPFPAAKTRLFVASSASIGVPSCAPPTNSLPARYRRCSQKYVWSFPQAESVWQTKPSNGAYVRNVCCLLAVWAAVRLSERDVML